MDHENVHELSVARSLHRWALSQIETLGPERLVAIELERDPMSCINTESLRFGFEAMAAGGPLAGVDLVVNDTTSRYHCHHCGHVVCATPSKR